MSLCECMGVKHVWVPLCKGVCEHMWVHLCKWVNVLVHFVWINVCVSEYVRVLS